MAMNAATLASAVKAALTAEGFFYGPGEKNTLFVDKLCEQIVLHIQTNAIVSGSIAVTSVSGVTPGGGVSGPGVGTLSAGVIT